MDNKKIIKHKIGVQRRIPTIVIEKNKQNSQMTHVIKTVIIDDIKPPIVDDDIKPITKIILYNLFHLGDLLFSQPIIRNLCINNPHFHFTLAIKYCTFLFCEIPNLQVIVIPNMPDHPLEQNIRTPFFLIDPETIAINLWIFAMAQNNWTVCNHIEVSLPDMFDQFSIILQMVQKQYNVQIHFSMYDLSGILPILPLQTDISVFENWLHNSKYEQTILYFNYHPMSGQVVPIEDHNKIILQLSTFFPKSAIIIPKMPEALVPLLNSNIIDAEKVFDCQRIEPLCEHLCKLGKITLRCTYAIIFDIGACYFHVNQDFIHSNVQILHVSMNNHFFQKIKSHWTELPENRMRFLQASNDDEILDRLQTIISK